jgi:hypothetical protein
MSTRALSQSIPARASQSQYGGITLLYVFLFAVTIQVIFLSVLPKSARVNESTDYFKYYSPVAQNFLNGKGLVLDSGEFGTLYPAGFPIFLAGTYYAADLLKTDRIQFVTASNIILMAVGCVLVFLTAERVFTRQVAIFSAALWSTYIFNLWLIKQPNSEVLFIPVFLDAVYCLIRSVQSKDAKWAAISGFLLGVAALVRPIALMLAPMLSLLLLMTSAITLKKRLILAIIIVGTFAVTVLPWEADVYRHTGQIVPLSTNGASSMLDGLTFARRSGNDGVPVPVVQLMQRIAQHGRELNTPGKIFHYLAVEAKQNPKPVFELFLLKLARGWFGTDSGLHEHAILVVQLVYLALCGAGLVLMAIRFRERRYYLALFVLIVFYFWGMAVIALSILRYMVPAMAYLLIPAAGVPAILLERNSARGASA